jgi:hypothetical protein
MSINLIILQFTTFFRRCTSFTNPSAYNFFDNSIRNGKRPAGPFHLVQTSGSPRLLSMHQSGVSRWEISLHCEGIKTLPIPPSKLAQAVILYSGDARFKYRPKHRLSWWDSRGFPQSIQTIAGIVSEIGYDLFLHQDPLQFTELPHQSYYHSTLYTRRYWHIR